MCSVNTRGLHGIRAALQAAYVSAGWHGYPSGEWMCNNMLHQKKQHAAVGVLIATAGQLPDPFTSAPAFDAVFGCFAVEVLLA